MVTEWLRSLWRRPPSPEPPKPDLVLPRTTDLLSAAERDSIVASQLSERLRPLGLVQIAPRRWVDGSAPPARLVFEMALLKGASMKANWGFSLDFVPHLSGCRVCWHRSDRAARLDVFVDPCDHDEASFLFGAEWLRRDLERLIPTAVERAHETWRRGSTWRGMLDIVREIRERRSNCLYFEDRELLPLALIFLTAKVGDLAAAQAELEAHVRRRKLTEKVAAKLAKLVQDVASPGLASRSAPSARRARAR